MTLTNTEYMNRVLTAGEDDYAAAYNDLVGNMVDGARPTRMNPECSVALYSVPARNPETGTLTPAYFVLTTGNTGYTIFATLDGAKADAHYDDMVRSMQTV